MASSILSCSHHNFLSILLALSLIISTFHIAFSASSSSDSTNTLKTYQGFIKGYCSSTTYPKNCYKYLSPYASVIKTSPLVLTKTSIFLALNQTSKSSSSLKSLSKLKGLTRNETLVIKDCLENLDDSLDEVKESAAAVKNLNGSYTAHEAFQWDNIKTWMSAAITDYSTCTDEFDEKKIRVSFQKKITSSITNAENIISNALSVVNKFTSSY